MAPRPPPLPRRPLAGAASGRRSEEALALAGRGRCLQAMRRTADARRVLARSRAILTRLGVRPPFAPRDSLTLPRAASCGDDTAKSEVATGPGQHEAPVDEPFSAGGRFHVVVDVLIVG